MTVRICSCGPSRGRPGDAFDSPVLLLGVPLCGGEILPQRLCRAARTVAGRVPLNAPAFLERARVDRVEPELIEQMRNRRFGLTVVTSDDERPAIGRARLLPVRRELCRV